MRFKNEHFQKIHDRYKSGNAHDAATILLDRDYCIADFLDDLSFPLFGEKDDLQDYINTHAEVLQIYRLSKTLKNGK